MVSARVFTVVLVLVLLGSFTFYTFLTPSSPTSSTSVSTATTATQTVDHTQTITKTVNNTVTVTTTAGTNSSLRDQYIQLGVQSGYNSSFLGKLYDKYTDFMTWALKTNSTGLQDVWKVASKNGTLFDQLYRNPTQDTQVASSNKYPVISLLSQLFSQQERYSAKMPTIHTAGNITNYEQKNPDNVFGKTNMTKILDDVEAHPEIVSDFNSSRLHDLVAKLFVNVRDLENYPKDWNAAAIQVDSLLYKSGLVTPQNEKDVLTSIVKPTVQYFVNKLNSGEAQYNLNLPNQQLEKWAREESMFPWEQLHVNITSGAWSDSPQLPIAKYNISPNNSLGGKTPQVWIEQMAKNDFNQQTPRYQLAMMKDRIYSKSFWQTFWPQSYNATQRALDIVLKNDPQVGFIIGYPKALSSEYLPLNLKPVINMTEQTNPYFSSFVARSFGRVSFVITDDYPPGFGGHSEPYVLFTSPDLENQLEQAGKLLVNNLFGGWEYSQPLVQDHQSGVPANPRITRPDGTQQKITI